MRAMRAAALLVTTAAWVLGLAGSALAQVTLGGFKLDGQIETGARFFLAEPTDRQKAKLEEYRDLPAGLFLESLRLRFFDPSERYSGEFLGSKWGQKNQEFSLRVGYLGLWEFGFDWDQTPHVYSTTARTLAVEQTRGVWVLPDTRPALNQHNGAPRLDEVSVRWDTAKLLFRLTPTPDLELRAEYTRINKDGDKPFSMAFGSPGSPFYEILEPIEHTIQDLRLTGALAREGWQLQAGYTLSVFENGLKSVIASNPCFGLAAAVTAATPGCSATATDPGLGRTSLPPDNLAHTLNLAGGVNLPLRTRLNANLAYSVRLQDVSFLPHTINPAVDTPLLSKSLDGNVQTLLVNLGATSRPLRPLTLTAKYRLFDLMDQTDDVNSVSLVVNDRARSVHRRAGRWDHTRQNLDLDGRWQLVSPVAVTLGTGWERWDRNEHREAQESDELFAKAALDLTPLDWLLARLTYNPSFRRIAHYKTFAHREHSVEEDPGTTVAQGQSVFLRKFDEGERDRQRLDFLLQLTPLETVSATVTAGWRNDDYLEGQFGLRDATTWSAGIDLSWSPVERVSLTGGYMRELIYQKLQLANRPGSTRPDPPTDFAWNSANTDTVDTVHLSAQVALIPAKLELTFGGNYSYGLGRVETWNPQAPVSGTAADREAARAKRWPAFEDSLLRLDTKLKYHLSKTWTATFGYALEVWEKHDWRTDELTPFIPGVTSIWMGTDAKDYVSHLVGATLTYRFK